MFNFLRKKVKKEDSSHLEEVAIDDLEVWFNNKLSHSDFQEQVHEFLNQLKDYKWALGEKILQLEEAKIGEDDDKRIEDKIKNVVLGHKNNYIKEMNRFLEKLNIPDDADIWSSIRFSQDLNSSLDELSQRTAKNYQASQYLFFQPVEEVFKLVSSINALTKEFNKKIEDKKLHKVDEIKTKITVLTEKKKIKEKLTEALKNQEERLQKNLEHKTKQEKEKERISQSSDFANFNSLKEKELSIKRQLDDNKNEVFKFFYNLERALRKYEKLAPDQKLVKAYLEDTITAFSQDSALRVVGVLENMESCLKSGELALDDRQKEVVLEQISRAKNGHLRNLSDKRKEVQTRLDEVKSKLKRYTFDEQMEELDYKLDHFAQQIDLTQKELVDLKTKLDTLDKRKVEEEAVGLIKEVLNTDIRVG